MPAEIVNIAPTEPLPTIWKIANDNAPPMISPGPLSVKSDAELISPSRERTKAPSADCITMADAKRDEFAGGTSR